MPTSRASTRYFRLTACLVAADVQPVRTAHYRSLLRRLDEHLRALPLDLLAYCLVPHALHLVLAARERQALDAFVARVAGTRYPGRREPARRLPVVVRHARSGRELIGHCAFVERRPVALGLVRQAQDWPWSSVAERFRLEARLPLRPARVLMSQAWLDHLNAPRPTDASAVCRYHFADPPRPFAGGFERAQHAVDIAGSAHENQADAHVERAEHLGVVNAPRRLQPREHRRNRPASAVD